MTIGRKIAGAFGALVLVIVLLGLTAYDSNRKLEESSRWLAHTHQVLWAIEQVEQRLVSAETGQRGYLLTGRSDYLEPYRHSVGRVEGLVDELQRLTADNPGQQARIQGLRAPMRSKLDELAETIRLYDGEGREAALALVLTDAGKRDMEVLRRGIDELRAEEERLVAARLQANAAVERRARWSVFAAVGLAVLLALSLGWAIVRELQRQIGQAILHLQSTSSELRVAAAQQSTSAQEQSAAITEVGTTVSEVLATSRQISESATAVGGVAEDSARLAQDGQAVVAAGKATMGDVQRQVGDVVERMLGLGQRSQRIEGVVGLINELAEQTNILAVNARIEAAGAGAAGVRFAAVADEIRALADRVGASAREIRQIVSEIRGSVDSTVLATEAGSKAVEASAEQLLEIERAFDQIVDGVLTSRQGTREIELSSQQQNNGMEQVVISVGSIQEAASQHEASSRQVVEMSEQLLERASDLRTLIASSGP